MNDVLSKAPPPPLPPHWPVDLHANQSGRLSERQLAILRHGFDLSENQILKPSDYFKLDFGALYRTIILRDYKHHERVFRRIDRTQLMRDLDNPIVRCADGYIISWTRGFLPWGYPTDDTYWVAQLSERGVEHGQLIPGLNALPGPYRLYYLQNSRTVVNAVPLVAAERYQAHYKAILEHAQQRSPEDELINRNGRMTESQSAALRRVDFHLVLYLWTIGGLALVAPAAAVFSALQFKDLRLTIRRIDRQLMSLDPLAVIPLVLVLIGIVCAAYYVSTLLRVRQRYAAAKAGQLVTVAGRVTLDWRKAQTNKERTLYFVNIGDARYRVTAELWTKLIDGRSYRAFIVKGSDLAIAFELLA